MSYSYISGLIMFRYYTTSTDYVSYTLINKEKWVIYPLPINMHCSVANSDIKTRYNMMTFRAINYVLPLPVGVKKSI